MRSRLGTEGRIGVLTGRHDLQPRRTPRASGMSSTAPGLFATTPRTREPETGSESGTSSAKGADKSGGQRRLM
jgi:hypothetical protein